MAHRGQGRDVGDEDDKNEIGSRCHEELRWTKGYMLNFSDSI